ncbi:MAG: hypothetical protein ABW150_15060 [Candidatus Thiodiazotropha sp.]
MVLAVRHRLWLLFTALTVTTMAGAEYADVILNRYAEQEGMRPVIFPHWFHRIRFRCKVCHNELGFLITHEAQLLSLWCKHNGTY